MSKLLWDQIGERLYETGVQKGVIYPQVAGAYPKGAAWNGLISVTESPSGAEATALYANDRKYLDLISNEEYGASIEAYMFPDEFAECNGLKELAAGVRLSQQARKPFGLSFRSTIGNDELGNDYGYKLHIVYGCKAAPSENAHTSVNDSPEATTLSWEITTTAVEIPDVTIGEETVSFKPTAHFEFDSTKVSKEKLAALEAILYGTDGADGGEGTEARLPLPAEIITLMTAEG